MYLCICSAVSYYPDWMLKTHDGCNNHTRNCYTIHTRWKKKEDNKLKIDHISKTFAKGTVNEKKALDDISLTVDTGDFITIIGSNGAGKSTLFNSISGEFFVDTGKIIFEYPDSWEVEKADILSNPDCIATLSKGQCNLINAVSFPTATNLDDYKIFMEDAISNDGGNVLASDFVQIAEKDAIKLHANIDTPDINFDIHTYVFVENGEIYIFELRTLDVSGESESEFKNIISSLKF